MENEKEMDWQHLYQKLIWQCLHVKLLWRQNSVFLFCLTLYKKQTHEQNKNLFRLTHSGNSNTLKNWHLKKKTKKRKFKRLHLKSQGLKLTFSESSFNFLQNRVVFCTLYPRGYTGEGSAPYNPRSRCQRLVRLRVK